MRLVHENSSTSHAAANAHASAKQGRVPSAQLGETGDNLAGTSWSAECQVQWGLCRCDAILLTHA